jgi:hypothetical protein
MSVCPFSKYKNILGVIGTGMHKYKFLNTAVFDYVLTIIAACITTYFSSIPLVLTTIAWFTMGIILHILFGVETSTLIYLGIKCE